jgi:hypothetical protein
MFVKMLTPSYFVDIISDAVPQSGRGSERESGQHKVRMVLFVLFVFADMGAPTSLHDLI